MSNTKSTKRALVSSTLAILMCVAMLIGTTFAWFTDTASTAVNKIQAGTLDVQLLDAATLQSVEGQTLAWKTADSRGQDEILWEPGCTYELQPVVIKNNGNLALKYKIVITGIQGDAELNEAIEWTIDGLAVDTEYSLAAGADPASLTISGHMKETAGNEYQGLSIDGIGITVIATQDTVEHDSTDNTYDAGAVYPVISVDELKAALAAPDSYISLGSDITVPSTQLGSESGYGKSGLAQTQGGIIDGNGNTISVQGATGTWDATIYTKGGTIRNAEITGGFRGIFIAGATEDIIIDNVIINPIAYPINCDSGNGKNLIVTNSTLNGWTSYAGTLASAEFTNCNFGSNGSYAYLRPYCATTLTNCEFSDGFELDATRTSEITLVNCTYNGTPITTANLISLLGADAAKATVN